MQQEIGSVRTELQPLWPLERGLRILLENMTVLGIMDRVLQKMEESDFPNVEQGKEVM